MSANAFILMSFATALLSVILFLLRVHPLIGQDAELRDILCFPGIDTIAAAHTQLQALSVNVIGA